MDMVQSYQRKKTSKCINENALKKYVHEDVTFSHSAFSECDIFSAFPFYKKTPLGNPRKFYYVTPWYLQ